MCPQSDFYLGNWTPCRGLLVDVREPGGGVEELVLGVLAALEDRVRLVVARRDRDLKRSGVATGVVDYGCVSALWYGVAMNSKSMLNTFQHF